MSTKHTTAAKVRPESLPRCLRHGYSGSVLEDAKQLVIFLEEISGWLGLGLVLDLLRDKIEIASGEYKFPLSGSSSDPVLVEREGGEL